MNARLAAAFLACAGVASLAARSVVAEPGPSLQWNQSTLRFVAPGAYPRMARLHDGTLILSYDQHGRSYLQRSADEGRTFEPPVVVADFAFGSTANTQPLVLQDGTLWVFYNERPRDGVHPFTIRLTVSTDAGRTWTPRPKPLYVAGTQFGDGCWEPAAVQLKTGEIQLFFADENPYRSSDEQQITMMRTVDAGKTWTKPNAVSFRTKCRDGMPVPASLQDGSVAFSIEDNGLSGDHKFKPTIVHSGPNGVWNDLPRTPASPQRWAALGTTMPTGVDVAAPFLCQLPSGITLLSCQSNEDGKPLTMTVFIGDVAAKHFAGASRPFAGDAGTSGLWNSLFVKNATTVTALSSATIKGRRGVWLVDGTLK